MAALKLGTQIVMQIFVRV
ncbi:hypothetical protein EYZ11_000553 [Aspergillus tanneri]|uniref:Uncharacterized protein n=1 Tax=Aspergillus tanneri TaxID=1220188 RepID=A0A4S3JWU8_9EURO|nr:hypothetical protein EYZ11_000553 [Aspergillus tanneri]